MRQERKPLGMALFLVIALIAVRFWGAAPQARGEKGVLGGPSVVSQNGPLQESSILVGEPMPGAGGDAIVEVPPGAEEAIANSGLLWGVSGPGGHDSVPGASSGSASSGDIPKFDSAAYFAMPANGFNFGKLHPHNAVDIANSCGTPIVAAAEGLVTDFSLDSWSLGYGHYVTLTHPNGLKTHYAHLGAISVSLGEYVKQGERLGLMDRTGDATGCHLHFEVEGASNPFAK